MNGIKVIVPADTKIDAVSSIITSAWNAGAARVSIEREIPVTVDMSVSTERTVCDAHAEALEINQGINEALRALASTMAYLPAGADCGRHCENTQEHIQKKFGVWIPYSMLSDLIERAAHACN